MRRKLSLCLAAWVFLTTHAARAESSPDDRLLLHLHEAFDSDFFDFSGTTETSIFRDGLVVERGSDSGNHCWIRRGAGTPEMLHELQEVLLRNRVGFQEGNCLIHEAVDNFAVERQVTWLGRGGRQHTYKTGNVFHDPCTAGTVEIDDAIRSFVANAQRTPMTFVPCP